VFPDIHCWLVSNNGETDVADVVLIGNVQLGVRLMMTFMVVLPFQLFVVDLSVTSTKVIIKL